MTLPWGRPREEPLARYKSGLLLWMALVVLSLSSFYSAPVDSPFVMPAAIREARLAPLDYNLDPRYERFVRKYTDETGVPLWIASRLFGQESVGDPLSSYWNARAVSWAGAEGLAQLMPENLALFAHLFNDDVPIDPWDPETSIRVGLRYLADLYEATGSWRAGLMSYNGGFGKWMNPRKYGPWQTETVLYVKAILGGAVTGGEK